MAKSSSGSIGETLKIVIFALAIALPIRHFLFEPYKIPSSSMVPNLLVGDFLFVNKTAYNTCVPFTNICYKTEAPKRGDIVVFQREDSNLPRSWFGLGPTFFVKRVMALPGDSIAYVGKRLYVNGKPADVKVNGDYNYVDGGNNNLAAKKLQENILGFEHDILIHPERNAINVPPVTVPQGQFVLMGDNRDNSTDSRYWNYPNWTFIPQEDLMGRAEYIMFSLDGFSPRTDRFISKLKNGA